MGVSEAERSARKAVFRVALLMQEGRSEFLQRLTLIYFECARTTRLELATSAVTGAP